MSEDLFLQNSTKNTGEDDVSQTKEEEGSGDHFKLAFDYLQEFVTTDGYFCETKNTQLFQVFKESVENFTKGRLISCTQQVDHELEDMRECLQEIIQRLSSEKLDFTFKGGDGFQRFNIYTVVTKFFILKSNGEITELCDVLNYKSKLEFNRSGTKLKNFKENITDITFKNKKSDVAGYVKALWRLLQGVYEENRGQDSFSFDDRFAEFLTDYADTMKSWSS